MNVYYARVAHKDTSLCHLRPIYVSHACTALTHTVCTHMARASGHVLDISGPASREII